MQIGEKRYIGDGVYVEYDGFHVTLKANSPDHPTDTISLDISVREELRKLLESFKEGGDNSVV